MVQFKFIIVILIVVLNIGCININVTPEKAEQSTQKATSNYLKTSNTIDTSKLDISKVVLNENEILSVLGNDWIMKENNIKDLPNNIQYLVIGYQKQNTYYKNPPNAALLIFILPNTTLTTEIYENSPIVKGKIWNPLDIGDSGKTSIDDKGFSIIVFRKNTIVAIVGTSVDQETTLNLAIKQEEKILRILEMIK